LELIEQLCSLPFFNDFFLVGGTALSLQIGHRKSIDIDFFSIKSFDTLKFEEQLSSLYPFKKLYVEKNTLKGIINGVFIDIITHCYPFINPPVSEDKIRLASIPDIAAMKINAIITSGERLKDFVDIAYLSSFMSLNEIINAFLIKYPNSNPILALKALLFFNDINFNVEIALINGQLNWVKVKNRIEMMCKNPDKIFSPIS